MRMDIQTDWLQNGKEQIISNNNSTTNIKNVSMNINISEGTVFDGKIQDILGNIVKINVGEGQILTALMENGVDFNIGEKVAFVVKSNDGGKIVLKSLFDTNVPKETILNSLDAAGMHGSEKNILLVREMMSYGMSIDKNSLNAMEKLVNNYESIDVETIVSMKSHNIPLSQENINQFQSYKSYENKITEAIDNLTKNIINFANENTNLSEKVVNDIITSLRDDLEMNMGRGIESNENISNIEVVNNANNQSTIEVLNSVNNENTVEILNNNQNESNIEILNNVKNESSVLEQNVIRSESFSLQENLIADDELILEQKIIDTVTKDSNSNVQEIIPNISQETLVLKLKELVKDIKAKWILDIDNLVQKDSEEVKDTIKKTYESMLKGSEKIMEALKNSGMEKTELFKSAENIKSNIQFMNDLNPLASYVQVPFKTFDGEGNGELYIYNRKQKKSLDDGPITAFLHLDMEHLGATDVKISLEKEQITTKFTLEDVVSQDIVEEHLPELKERLEKLGYKASLMVETIEPENKISPFEKILQADKPQKSVKRYSFDIRL